MVMQITCMATNIIQLCRFDIGIQLDAFPNPNYLDVLFIQFICFVRSFLFIYYIKKYQRKELMTI